MTRRRRRRDRFRVNLTRDAGLLGPFLEAPARLSCSAILGKGGLELIAKIGGGEQAITARGREPGARLMRVPPKEEIHARGECDSVARPFSLPRPP